jgi:hypothetical protein
MATRGKVNSINYGSRILDLADSGDKNWVSSALVYQENGRMSVLEIGGRGKSAMGASLEDLAPGQGGGGFSVKGRRLVFCNGGDSLVVASRENSPDRLVAKLKPGEGMIREYLRVGLSEELVVGASRCGRVDIFDFN